MCPSGYFQDRKGNRSCSTCLPDDVLCHAFPGATFTAARSPTELEGVRSSGILPRLNSSYDHTAAETIAANLNFLDHYGSMIYIILGGMISILLCTHRCWPVSWRRSDLLFAGDHYIGDGHAKRMLDSRLGAAFTLSLPFMLGIFSVSTFGEENVKVTQALIPENILEPRLFDIEDAKLFGTLDVSFQAYALLADVSCEQAMGYDFSLAHHMKCTFEVNQTDLGVDKGTLCNVHVSCNVGARLAGTSSLLFFQPDSFQSIRYAVRADSWNGIEEDSQVENILESRSGTYLAGEMLQPTSINFQLTRSRYQNKVRPSPLSFVAGKEPFRYGLQLTALEPIPVESSTGSRTGKHYVAFRFETTGSVFTKEDSDKVELASQLSRLFTLLLSVLAFFRFVKTYVELVTDNVCLYISGVRGTPVPEDVRQRVNVLEERHADDEDSGESSMLGNISVKEPSRRVSLLMSLEGGHKSSEELGDGTGIELRSMENPMVNKVEELRNVEDGEMKALLKRVLLNYERIRKENERICKENERICKDNERLHKQVASLDVSVSRLSSIVEGNGDVNVKKVSTAKSLYESEVDKRPLPFGWEAFETDDGAMYYRRPDGTTTWEPP